MSSLPLRRTRRSALGLPALALALALATSPAGASGHHRSEQQLVVRGDATSIEGPCDARVCGEAGTCAPLEGRFVLGGGTPDRLILTVLGHSCQDGAGPLSAASFTGLAQFTVKRGTGSYAGARGTGLASLSEDAANRHRMTLIGALK